MPTVGFESTTSAGDRPYTYALDRAAGRWDRPPTVMFLKKSDFSPHNVFV